MRTTESPQEARWSHVELVEALRADAWPDAAPVVRDATRQARRRALETVASTRDPFEAWYRLGGCAWDRTSDEERRRLYQLRAVSVVGTPRSIVRRMRDEAFRIALCQGNAPKARCVAHPVSVSDAVALSVLQPSRTLIEAGALAAADAVDDIGQATRALAGTKRDERPRRIVWRIWHPARGAATVRPLVLLVAELLEHHGGEARDIVLATTSELPSVHEAIQRGSWRAWPPHRLAILGALAWRATVAQGLEVTATRASSGHRLFVREDVVGRPFVELASPFELLLGVGRLGASIVGWSHEAIVIEHRA